jgi:hypothetical protein
MVARRLTEGITPQQDDSVVLVGPPRALRGRIHVRNNTDSRRTVRRGLVRGDILPPEAPELTCQVGPQRIEPGEIVETELAVSLPSTTPPGEYVIELELGGSRVRARAVVLEVVDTELTPSTIILEPSAEHAVRRRVAVHNDGNVAVVIGEIGGVVLDDELLDCRTMRGALTDLTDSDLSVERLLGAIARNAKTALDNAGTLRVHNASGRQTIEPGAIVVLDLDMRAPAHLDRHTRYRGRAYVGTSQLTFVVIPALAAPAPPKTG